MCGLSLEGGDLTSCHHPEWDRASGTIRWDWPQGLWGGRHWRACCRWQWAGCGPGGSWYQGGSLSGPRTPPEENPCRRSFPPERPKVQRWYTCPKGSLLSLGNEYPCNKTVETTFIMSYCTYSIVRSHNGSYLKFEGWWCWGFRGFQCEELIFQLS